MSDFIKSLKAERAELEPLANPSELPSLLKRQQQAKEELRVYLESPAACSYAGRAPRTDDLRGALQAVNQAVADLVQPKERAEARLREVDAMLNADRDADAARKRLNTINSMLREARFTAKQMAEIETTLQAEIQALEQQRASGLADHGKAELAARIQGKTIGAAKAVATVDADLASRRAALDATVTAKSDAEAQIAACAEDLKKAEGAYRHARMRQAEVAWYELVPTIMPKIALLHATGSSVGESWSDTFKVHKDRDSVAAAQQMLQQEIASA